VTQRVSVERLAQAAYWYYVQDLSQAEVARRLGTSRSNVSRLLRAAREQGVVRFEIAYPIRRELALEDRLRARFQGRGVRDVIVAAGSQERGAPRDSPAGVLAVARSAADWLEDNVRDGETLGLFWGETIKTMVDVAHFDRRIDAHVIQLAGEWSNDPRLSGHNLVRDLASKFGGRYTYFNAPAVAASQADADALLAGPEVSGALEQARSADVAIVGVGAFPTDTTRTFLELARATPDEIAEAETKRVVGQLAGRFFDDRGKQVELSLHGRVVSLELQDVREIKTIVVVASGENKGQAVLGALRGGLADVLIVDPPLAHALLAGQE
jgi:deoxyribonucleoside regulator